MPSSDPAEPPEAADLVRPGAAADPAAGALEIAPGTPRPGRAQATPRLTRRRWALWALGVVAAGFAFHLLLGNDVEITGATRAIERLNWGWLLVGIAAELGSYASYAAAQRRLLLAGGSRVGLVPLTGVALASQAVANCLPAGTAFGAIAGYRLVHRRGVPQLLTAWMLLVVTVLYVAVLAVLAVIAAQIVGPQPYLPNLSTLALGILGLLIVLGGATIWLQRRGQLARAARGVARLLEWISGWHRPKPAFVAEAFFARLGSISVRGSGWLAPVVLLLTVAWLTDAACLLLSFYAVGVTPPVRGILLAYCAGQLVAVLPATPGGLGLVEGSLTLALVAFGGAEIGTLAAVLLYRLVSFWGVIGAGIVSYAGLRLTGPGQREVAVKPAPRISEELP